MTTGPHLARACAVVKGRGTGVQTGAGPAGEGLYLPAAGTMAQFMERDAQARGGHGFGLCHLGIGWASTNVYRVE